MHIQWLRELLVYDSDGDGDGVKETVATASQPLNCFSSPHSPRCEGRT
jgi:hypothetical protein